MNYLKRWDVYVVALALVALIAHIAIDGNRASSLHRMRQAGYWGEVTVLDAPATAMAGQELSCAVLIRNAGNNVWLEQGREEHYIALGLFEERLKDRLTGRQGHSNEPQYRLLLEKPLGPGKWRKVRITFTAPDKPGRYKMRVQMVKEGVGWFGTIAPFDLQVTGAVGNPAAPSNSFLAAEPRTNAQGSNIRF